MKKRGHTYAKRSPEIKGRGGGLDFSIILVCQKKKKGESAVLSKIQSDILKQKKKKPTQKKK